MRHLMCLVILTIVSFGSGCSKQPGIEGLVPVTGTVTYHGKPVAGATVTFSPSSSSAGEGRSASAITDTDGVFALTTLQAGDGALPGTYQVAIDKTEVVNPLTPEQVQAYFHEHGGRMPSIETRQLLPEKYQQTDTSGLTAKVDESEENHFPYDLAD